MKTFRSKISSDPFCDDERQTSCTDDFLELESPDNRFERIRVNLTKALEYSVKTSMRIESSDGSERSSDTEVDTEFYDALGDL